MKHLEEVIAFLNNTKEKDINELLEPNLTDIEKLRLLTGNTANYVKDSTPKE